MSNISLLLLNVHANVYNLSMKLNYSEPKIYTGGVDIKNWSKLTKEEQQVALNKDWYVYYSFRNPESGKLKRQPNIKAGVNRIKNKQARYRELKVLQESLLLLLRKGFNPYKDNSVLINEVNGESVDKETVIQKDVIIEKRGITIHDAIEFGLELKKKMMSNTSYSQYKSRILRFEKWLINRKLDTKKEDIARITKKVVNDHLNDVLQSTSARNRNNTRTDLSSLFKALEDNDVIKENFIKKIAILKSVPIRNKSYSPELQKEIYEYLEQNNPILLLFVKFVSYNFLRPIEVCRLRVEDIDVKDKKIYVKAKNSPVKIKIIPDILLNDLPDLSQLSKKYFLFTPSRIGGKWDIDETYKRDYFTKSFKKVKDHFYLGKEYGLYSFRHTFIAKLYREMVKDMSPFETKSKLKLITGHSTMRALEQYLRDIDAELPDDYSNLLM
ncbi:MAG: site-specific integrase [Flavobacteriaceae bacterium]|nr:site-specific integrase [Flavobacteriaceae bacterium]